MTGPDAETQTHVQRWFDHKYAEAGFDYLRPYAAYPLFVQLLDLEPGDRLLDVGCGPGHVLRAAAARGLASCGVDLSAAALALARAYVEGARVTRANAERLPFRDDTFAAVTCIAAFERFLDRGRVLREILRVATSDARLCFMVRNSRTPSWRVWRQLLGRRNVQGHQDALDLAGWTDLFVSHGLKVERVIADQWGRQRLHWWMRGRRDPDPGRTERVRRTLLPIRWANEFIFLLSRAVPR